MKTLLRILFLFAFLYTSDVSAQSFYDLNTIQKIELNFSQANWDYQMDTAKEGAEDYIMAGWIKINGVRYDSVGVKYKGNSSFDSTYSKNPLHIAMDEYKDQSFEGYTDIKLGNGYADPSMIREVLSYHILQNYMDCPLSNFAQLYINGTYVGLYSNVESINKKFCSDHFFSSQNTFVKCNPVVHPGPTTKSNLKFISTDSSQYFNFYEMKSKNGWNDLVALCDTLTNHQSKIAGIIDIDRVLWMLAFNNVLVNLDSYTGVFAQNYYLYRDSTNRFNPVVWDLNMSFGGFPYVGSSNTSMGSLTVSNMQQLPLTFHSSDPYWPLINAVMNNAQYKRMYIAHAKTICNEILVGGNYQVIASQLQNVVDTAVLSDANKFFSYSDFQNGLTANTIVGTYTVPGLNNLVGPRLTYLQSTSEFSAIAPVIDSVYKTNSQILLNDTVNILTSVQGTADVYIGYRFENTQKFIRELMYDDGLHNDAIAGDNIYGLSIVMSSSQCQYYIYAENINAGIFSPARAEHEFYSLSATAHLPKHGEIVINEFVSSNQGGAIDEYGDNSDWIELYNTTSDTLDLHGLFLSDNFSSPYKFAFPERTIVAPKGFLVIWADDNTSTSTFLHSGFKLSAGGENIMLSTFETVLDSITFRPMSSDVSIGRCPDGSGSFAQLLDVTFNLPNCKISIPPLPGKLSALIAYPSPADKTITIHTDLDGDNPLEIFNVVGDLIYSGIINHTLDIPVTLWSNGLYLSRMNNLRGKIIIAHQ